MEATDGLAEADRAGLARILGHIRHTRGFDLTAYTPARLLHRIRQRMQALEIDGLDAYLERLRVDADEFGALFDTVLNNTTAFFRDAEVWEALRQNLLPKLGPLRGDRPIRIWSAGASSGEEAYSAAMMLAEALGRDAFRERVTIYATDVDDAALAAARRAVYDVRQLARIPPKLRRRYFDRRGGQRSAFDRQLRRSVIVGRHDLIQDAPVARVDLLLCRNTLIYFHADARARMMARFHASLNPGGHLVLGRGEPLVTHTPMFRTVARTHRIFKKSESSRW